MTRIKICGMTRLDDALHAARSGADAIGLIFYAGSARHVAIDTARDIALRLPPFVTRVGLFVNASAETVRATLRQVPLDLLQFHGEESAEFCRQFGRAYIKALRVKPGVDLLQYAGLYAEAAALLLDTYVDGAHGGTGHTFDWGLIPASVPLPIILSGGLTPDNVTEAVRQVRPWAVDVSSGVERAKGIKDPEQVTRFIQGVRNANV